MKQDVKDILKRIVEKADKLSHSSFSDFIANKDYTIRITGTQIELVRPEDEAIESFILTFRFFIVNNEATSFKELKKLLDESEISESWKNKFRELSTQLNACLDRHSVFTYDETQNPTNREIMNLFLYGGLVHANNPEKVQEFKQISENPILLKSLEMVFVKILSIVLEIISELAEVSRQELVQHNEITNQHQLMEE
jgi:hypothetical protein